MRCSPFRFWYLVQVVFRKNSVRICSSNHSKLAMLSSGQTWFNLLFLALSFLGVQSQRHHQIIPGNNLTASSRQGKVFSLFNIVQFNNDGCRSSSTISSGGTGSTNRNGTCFTATECVSKSGTAAGSCAAGFGVCCVFLVSSGGATINQNCTYIRNPNFPNAYDSTSQVAYTIRKCDPRVCQLRLDFESFSIQGTGNIEETDTVRDTIGGVCLDMFKVTTNTGSPIPTICGQNTGQHMYIDLGCERSDTATLSFDFDGSDNNRLWEIKVSQIKCNTEGHPNGCGCLQYHTGLTGRFTSFNFLPTNDNHLANQEYAICIRQEEGMCCIEYTPCADTNSYSFNAIEADPDDGTAKQDTDCATFDYIGIEGVQATCSTSSGNIQNSRLCGQKFNVIKEAIFDAASLCDCSKPFQVDIFFNGMTDLAADEPNEGQSRGVCLEYRQVPC